MAEINARALMFNLGREDAIDSTTSAKIARYAERKQLAYKLTDEGMLLLDGRGKKIHLRNGVVTLRKHWVCTLYRNGAVLSAIIAY